MVLNSFYKRYYEDSHEKCKEYDFEYKEAKVRSSAFKPEIIKSFINAWITDYQNHDTISGSNFSMEISKHLTINNQLERTFMIEAAVRDFITNKTGITINYTDYNCETYNDEAVCEQIYGAICTYILQI